MAVLQYRFLVGEEETDSFRLLGYPLTVSPTQRTILFALLRSEELKAEELAHALARPMKPSTLAVHVCVINQRARALSGRRLIVHQKRRYRLNLHM